LECMTIGPCDYSVISIQQRPTAGIQLWTGALVSSYGEIPIGAQRCRVRQAPEAGGLLEGNERELELNPHKISLQRVREAWGKVTTACYHAKNRHASIVICQ
jgi:hypothetical protein